MINFRTIYTLNSYFKQKQESHIFHAMNATLFLCITRRGKLTDSAEAVDVLSAGTLLRDVDVLEGLLTVVAQCQLQGHHAVAIDTGLAGEAVLGG